MLYSGDIDNSTEVKINENWLLFFIIGKIQIYHILKSIYVTN